MEQDTLERLEALSASIQQVYIPLMESKVDIKIQMENFVRQIQTSVRQASGNVTLKVTEIPEAMSDGEVMQSQELIDKLTADVETWTETIKQTIATEEAKPPETNTASGEAARWRGRSATFNTLYQQLTSKPVRNVITIMTRYEENPSVESSVIENYNQEYTRFTKLHAQALDFVKFLTTLERQFKSITQGDLVGIEETIPSLLNGLKLIFTISRHINAETTKMEKLLHSISNEICEKVAHKINLKTIFRDKPDKSIAIIEQGEKCLNKWVNKFQETKKEIEKENNGQNRWDFSTTGELFDRPRYMRQVLGSLKEACTILKDFFAILGPDLKAVTGDAEQIDELMDKVKASTDPIVNFPNDVFDKTYENNWNQVVKDFQDNTEEWAGKTVDLINNTFQHKLNSSEGAFDLLRNFKVIKTRDVIEKELSNKYKDVINQYKKELQEMSELFNMHKENPPIPKNMPPTAGKIAWARSIMNRIKGPIFKFKTKEGLLTKDEGPEVTKRYITLTKQLDVEYEEKIFTAWNNKNTDHAIQDLKLNILAVVDGRYVVNFSNRLKVIIREAKFLDRIGREIPPTIINIALQEKEYAHYVDRLNQLLREYNSVLEDLNNVEKKLLEQQIKKLDHQMNKGQFIHNWFSLSIKEFIIECNRSIDEFKVVKNNVLQSAHNIEKKVMNIQNAVILREIDFGIKEPMEISEFMEFFDTHMKKVLAELEKDYQNIGDQDLKQIEAATVSSKTNSQNELKEEMRPYFQYWERRIFNAITKMIIRAMAACKVLFCRNKPSLLVIRADLNYPAVTLYPPLDELMSQLERFTQNILNCTHRFGRWMDGFCRIFEPKINPETSEKYLPYTFYDDVVQNPMVVDLQYEIIQQRNQIHEKLALRTKPESQNEKTKFKIFEKGALGKVTKTIEKQPQQTVPVIEQIMNILLGIKENFQRSQDTATGFFILIDWKETKSKKLVKVQEWIDLLGDMLRDNATKQLNGVLREIEEYDKQLKSDMGGSLDIIKHLLKIIDEIRLKSMDMEFEIHEVVEQFRILKRYEYKVDEDIKETVAGLAQAWADLLERAERKDFEVDDYKKNYAEMTKGDVLRFKGELKEEYEKYVQGGPGAEQVSLDEGLNLLEISKDQNRRFNQRKEECVLAEKLFNLPISKFPELISMESDNAVFDLIYGIYKEHLAAVRDWSMMPWTKLDSQVLTTGAQKFETSVRKLGNKLKDKDQDQLPPFQKLKTTITGFKDSLPLITILKGPAIKERHWARIMDTTGKNLGEINIKTLTLAKVFELELNNFEEDVRKICNEAQEEARNEDLLAKIENAWKTAQFDIGPYSKGTDFRGYAMKAPDDIRQLLEENILILQQLNASKYIKALRGKVSQWERDLNIISETVDTWLAVQRKWMYLESIFASEDIKMQLPDEAKKFQRTDQNYKKIMDAANKTKNVILCCVKGEGAGRLGELKNISIELDKCQKSLTNYLQSKRMSFPRFYFISDEDLLQILGSSEVRSISPHLLKLFDNCKNLQFGKGDKLVTGMESDEGEKYEFENNQKPEGKVEEWMNRVDDEMKSTLHIIVKKAVYHYAKQDRIEWIREQLGMVAIVGTQIWWTFSVEDVFNRVKQGDKHAMKNELKKESADLNDLIALVRQNLNSQTRKSVNTLIIMDVHARDIVDGFVRDSILDAREFEWESQLRFYWDRVKDDISIQQCTGLFDYCYEYQGLNGRLVITPLTDRCVMTLTTALTFKLGGAPAGPAGTGKTETVKDLAKSLAIRCVVTNCGDTLDSFAMGIIFSGLIQTGFWGCFDEFNRINPEVLSVVSAQIKTMQNGLIYEKKKIEFEGEDMRLIPTVGVFVTMNPGYAGRSELPDNLKALFRPVTMIVPDLVLICENMLMSEGFQQAKLLAKKMTVLYKLSKEQLSKQYHYDFQLRALKSVLVMAGQLKRTYSDLPENVVLMRALRDMNMPKFVFEDVPLFQGLIADLFPGLQADRVGEEDLKNLIIDSLNENKYHHSNEDLFMIQVDKIIQLYETMNTRHTTMVVGPTGSGKSVVINTLGKALAIFRKRATVIDTINPKMVTNSELYGVLDPESRDWTDGLLSKLFKEANTEQPGGKVETRWILYDGDVDAVWVENMNSVMDDNKVLTLTNGDRIRLLRNCAMLFEVFDLQYASPATISRCGMVYVDPKNLGYEPFFERWKGDMITKHSEQLGENLQELYEKFVPPCIDRIFEGVSPNEEDLLEPLRFITPRTTLNLVQQLTLLLDSALQGDGPEAQAKQELDALERIFVLCLTWSLGGALVAEDRPVFSEFMRSVAQMMLPPGTMYEHQLLETNSWQEWSRSLPDYVPPASGKFSEILVPTVDTQRYSWFLGQIMKVNKPCMFCGHSGTAKTVTIFSHFKTLLPEKNIILNINFSSRTTSADCQKTIEENIEKKSFKNYGPTGGRRLICFIDDLNMPKIDTYGTQSPIALLKFLIERNQLYQRGGDLELRNIVDTQYVGSMTPPGGGNNPVDPRFMSLFAVVNITSPSREDTEEIFKKIMRAHLEQFPQEVQDTVENLTRATTKLFYTIVEKLPRTPLKFHYIFNLRDISRVFQGMCQMTLDKFTTKDKTVRMWRNESTRVFVDRLISVEDRNLINEEVLPGLVKEFFADVEEPVKVNPILFGDFAKAEGAEESEEPRLYEDLGGYEQVRKKMAQMLEEYGYDHKPMSLVLFNDALDHLTNIHRIIRFPRGCALLVGVGGSGKQSLTKLATFTANYELFTINLVRGYKEDDFREELRTLYKEVLDKPKTFLFTDSHVVEEGFLELINNILTIGMVPALFPEEEKDGLTQPIEDEVRKMGLPETKESKWAYFVGKCRDQIHIVLAMSPAGENLRVRCRNFPGLVSNTSIDWFFPWPEDALSAVAQHFLVEVQLDDEIRGPINDHVVLVHQSVQKFSTEFENIYKRKNFSTPKNYLDFIQNYMSFLKKNRIQIDKNVARLEAGLETLAKAAADTQVLSEELAVENEKIRAKAEEVGELIKEVTKDSEDAAVKKQFAAEKEAQLAVQSEEIRIEEEEAQRVLSIAEPILAQAKEAASKISSKQVTDIKALNNPPEVVKMICTCIYLLYQRIEEKEGGKRVNEGKISIKDTEWGTVKTTALGDMKLLARMMNYRIEFLKKDNVNAVQKILDSLEKLRKQGNPDPPDMATFVKSKSEAALGMYNWTFNTLKVYEIWRDVEPKQIRAQKLREEKAAAEVDLANTKQEVAKISARLEGLNQKKKVKQDELDDLSEKQAVMQRKLDAASKLITGLGSENKRWTEDMGVLKENKVKLVGDCLISSAFLSYCGAFNFELRQKMVFECWKADIAAKGIAHQDDYRLEKMLADDVSISRWASEGLPTDELSVQNGILTVNASRFPLCVDPQMQAVAWIKEMEAKNTLQILSFNQSDYITRLEMAVSGGLPVLFEAIDEELDPMIDPVLEKNIINKAGVDYLKIGEEVEYNHNFRLYLTTKISNPNYPPEVFGKSMIINFNVTIQGLSEQLLNEVVGFEREDLERQRKQLVIETSQNRATLKELEDTLLSELSKKTDIPLVDNEPLIQTLDNTKSKATEIAEAIENAKETAKIIDESRESYKGVAKRGAILFFAMQGLSAISEMYEYSLNSYLTVFMNALATARKDNILQNRLKNITDRLTTLVYEFTCMGIFETHKLMFSFQMTTMIMDGDGVLDKGELDFFLKGNTSLDAVPRQNPYKWLSAAGWKDMQKLATLGPAWKDILNDVEGSGKKWKAWYDLETPEQSNMPCGYSDKLSKFQALLILRCFRPDRIIQAIKIFIIHQMGSNTYVNPPSLQYKKIFQQSTENTPIVFILSPGADPQSDVQKLVEEEGVGMNKFRFLALGQGMGPKAEELITNGAIRGHWVMLQNCHLLVSWLKTLEKIVEAKQGRADKNFRLWLTTAPTDKFPLGILQRALKVVTEPPEGLGQNIRQSYTKISDEMLDECPKQEFKSLVYVLAYFHATIQERKKFGKIGWNVTYDFNESDFRISFRLISMYLAKAHTNNEENLPWDTLRYLIGEAMYGGRVTDDFDRRVLNTYLKEYLGDFIFDRNQKFFFSQQKDFEYVIPDNMDVERYLEYIGNIPIYQSPTVFGLHPNAEIQYSTNSAKSLWVNMIEMQTSDGAQAGGVNREDYITSIATDLLEKIPQVYDLYNIRKGFDVPSPTQVVLLQEIERVNVLIKRMLTSLKDLKRALLGEIGMSQELDSLSTQLFNGMLPTMWAARAPQTQKQLVSWMEHFQNRLKQYNEWLSNEEPKCIWLSGFHIPESYLTALVQTTCRSKGWALDKSTLYTVVTKIRNPADCKKRLEQGCYINGLYLEGAKWNIDTDSLDYQDPKELVVELPVVQIVPVEANKLKLRGTIKTPVYVTQARRNAMGVGLVFTADLKTGLHVSHWILQGVALTLNID